MLEPIWSDVEKMRHCKGKSNFIADLQIKQYTVDLFYSYWMFQHKVTKHVTTSFNTITHVCHLYHLVPAILINLLVAKKEIATACQDAQP